MDQIYFDPSLSKIHYAKSFILLQGGDGDPDYCMGL
jgi:hypothetical protein